MNIFLLTDAGVKQALQHEALQGLPRIGRGKFSAVYDKGDTVLRVTVDPLAYDLHASFVGPTGEHFGRLVNDYQDIGEMTDWNGGYPIYMFETEKLEPLKNNLQARRVAKKLTSAIYAVHPQSLQGVKPSLSNYQSVVSCKKLRLIIDGDFGLPESILDSLDKLESFASNYESAGIDLHNANFMVRPGCGTLVFNDPFADVSKLHERQDTLSGRMAG